MASSSLPYQRNRDAAGSPVQPAHLIVLIALAVGAALWGWFLISGSRASIGREFLLWLGLFGLVSAGFIFTRVRGNHLRLFDLPIFLTVYIFLRFGLAPVGSFVSPKLMNPFLNGSQAPLLQALLYVMLGMVGFWIGCYVVCSKPNRNSTRTVEAPSREHFILVAAVGLYIVAFATKVYLLSHHLFSYLTSGQAYQQHLAGLQVLSAVAGLGTYALIILCIEKYQHPDDRLRSALFWAVFGSQCFWGLISGMKQSLLQNFVFVAIIASLIQRRVRTRWIVAAVAGMVLIYPFSNRYRQLVRQPGTSIASFSTAITAIRQAATGENETGSSGQSQSGWTDTLNRLDLLWCFGQILNLGPRAAVLQGKERWWMIPYFPFVPRFIWHSKPILSAGGRFSVALGLPATTSTAVSYPGDLYANFGLAGVVIGMLFLGLVAEWLTNLVRDALDKRRLFIYVAIFLAFTDMEIDYFSFWSGLIKSLVIVFAVALVVYGPRRQHSKTRVKRKRSLVGPCEPLS